MSNAPATVTDRCSALIAELPTDLVITDPDITIGYARDQSRFTTNVTPAAVMAPRTTAETAECLAAAHRHRAGVVVRGAGTGLSGGANCVPGAVVLSTHRMNKIVGIDTENRLATVQPGVVTAALRDAVEAVGLLYPPDPGSVEMCSIGGNIATNAGGICCVKYGVTGDYVASLEAVLSDGTVVRTGHRTRKGVVGYDTTRLLVGSEGSLAVITEATVRLVTKPSNPVTVIATFAELSDAGNAISAIHHSGVVYSMVEVLDSTTLRAVENHTGMDIGADVDVMLLLQYDGPDAEAVVGATEALLSSTAVEIAFSSDPQEARMLLDARRMALPALERLGDWLLDDVCVPVPRITDLISAIEHTADEYDLTIGVFGHAGDGNLHPTIIFDSGDEASTAAARTAFAEITDTALELGGTVSGEHGVGQLKLPWLTRELDTADLALQRRLRHAFDPLGILSPGE
ncbi:putative FAD/FMN-dependent dehydrogenase [Nocardia nova SH22a]|uniref:Putative FAD/FMN-dependent dehydrogenase n=1 Tax=Nocardia nova SH22a TaxID=1415166 RepID=W5TLU9_9NOCA|nr:FAD-linked oxidase C-terminal domain-containing protein [Nocardia nova]AHH19918.1 putative FAD/FMN-dependent dehydrogenase [Nocardia nova SH22a]